jgi:glucose 1-dehydrogenase
MRVAAITGGAGGIASACAERFLARGMTVTLLDRDEAALARAAARLDAGDRLRTALCDVAERAALERAFADIESAGSLGVAVSAVAHEVHGGWEEVEPEDLDASLRITVGGAAAFCRLAAARMIGSGSVGRIAIISSLHAVLPISGAIAYNAAQGALRQLGLTLAHELLGRVAVNLVEPGWIDTPGERRWYTDEQLVTAGARLPLGRLGRPADVAAAVDFLCSPDAAYITGATLRVDGGMSLPMSRLPEV